MLAFSLGTVPLMLLFGALSSLLSGAFTQKLRRVSAFLVVALGLVMFNRGLALSGITLMASGGSAQNVAVMQEDGVQTVTTVLGPGQYAPITVQAGIPVRWTIEVPGRALNGCNNPIMIPEYNLTLDLKQGENIVEFTPQRAGVVPYSCWMGMIRSSITVQEAAQPA